MPLFFIKFGFFDVLDILIVAFLIYKLLGLSLLFFIRCIVW